MTSVERGAMAEIFQHITDFMVQAWAASWTWIHSLDRTGWLLLLIVAFLIGLFCMRGYGSRKHY